MRLCRRAGDIMAAVSMQAMRPGASDTPENSLLQGAYMLQKLVTPRCLHCVHSPC
jgi:hypothetical protein